MNKVALLTEVLSPRTLHSSLLSSGGTRWEGTPIPLPQKSSITSVPCNRMVSDKCSEAGDESLKSWSYITFLPVSHTEKGRQGIVLINEQNHLEPKKLLKWKQGEIPGKERILDLLGRQLSNFIYSSSTHHHLHLTDFIHTHLIFQGSLTLRLSGLKLIGWS